VVICFQETLPGKSPYLILALRPQTINDVSTSNEDVCDVCNKVAKDLSKIWIFENIVEFLGGANYGVSCDKDYVYKTILLFLHGEKGYLAATDVNHNMKNARYQAIGFSSVVTIGKYFVDVGMLLVAGVVIELWQISDWASD